LEKVAGGFQFDLEVQSLKPATLAEKTSNGSPTGPLRATFQAKRSINTTTRPLPKKYLPLDGLPVAGRVLTKQRSHFGFDGFVHLNKRWPGRSKTFAREFFGGIKAQLAAHGHFADRTVQYIRRPFGENAVALRVLA
jgi:hypothetical protein